MEADKNGLEEAKANVAKFEKELQKQNAELKKSEVCCLFFTLTKWCSIDSR